MQYLNYKIIKKLEYEHQYYFCYKLNAININYTIKYYYKQMNLEKVEKQSKLWYRHGIITGTTSCQPAYNVLWRHSY